MIIFNQFFNSAMYYLIYTSHTKYPWDSETLGELLHTSVRNNKANNITGMLIYLRHTFIQLLEGDSNAINKLYQKITEDKRHEKVTILLEGQIASRNFEKWYMGFKALDPQEFESLSGYKDLKSLFDDNYINNQSHPALVFLKLFYTKNFRDSTYGVE